MVQYTEKVDKKTGDLFTRDAWLAMVKRGFLIDYDGYGHPVKNGKRAKTPISPSEADQLPKDATHVLWYNR